MQEVSTAQSACVDILERVARIQSQLRLNRYSRLADWTEVAQQFGLILDSALAGESAAWVVIGEMDREATND
jgi:hypothetical protein